MGLDQVRELTQRTQSAIIRKRPFSSLAISWGGWTHARWKWKTW